MKRSILTLALASVLVASGCGASEESEAKDAISTYLMDQQDTSQMLPLDQGEADCIAGDMVDGIGVDQLKEYGLLDEEGAVPGNARVPDMSEGDAKVMVSAIFDCTDVMATMQEELASAMGGQTPKVQRCLEKALTEELVRGVLVATFSGDESKAQQRLTEPLGRCITGGTDAPNGQ